MVTVNRARKNKRLEPKDKRTIEDVASFTSSSQQQLPTVRKSKRGDKRTIEDVDSFTMTSEQELTVVKPSKKAALRSKAGQDAKRDIDDLDAFTASKEQIVTVRKLKPKGPLRKKLNIGDRRFITTCPNTDRTSPVKPCRSILMAKMRRRNAKILKNKPKPAKDDGGQTTRPRRNVIDQQKRSKVANQKHTKPKIIVNRNRHNDKQGVTKTGGKIVKTSLKKTGAQVGKTQKKQQQQGRLTGGASQTVAAEPSKAAPSTTPVLYIINDRNFTANNSYRKMKLEAMRRHQEVLKVKRAPLDRGNKPKFTTSKFTKPQKNRNSSQLHFFMNMGQKRQKRPEETSTTNTAKPKMPKMTTTKFNGPADQNYLYRDIDDICNDDLYTNNSIVMAKKKSSNKMFVDHQPLPTGPAATFGKFKKNIRKNINEIEVPLTAHVPIIDITPVARGAKKLLERETHKYFQNKGFQSFNAFCKQKLQNQQQQNEPHQHQAHFRKRVP